MTKRLFPRIRTSVPVAFESEGAVETGRITDASQRGMRVLARRSPPLGRLLALDVTLPSGKATRVEARVVFVEPPGAGEETAFAVELTHPNEEWGTLLGLLVSADLRKRSVGP